MKIEKSIYQGYLWYSDQKAPQVLNNEVFELEIADSSNPFIVEGQLFDGQKVEQVFHSYRMDGEQLKFNLYWREVEDDLCEGMKVLQPAELVFVGFNDKED